MMEPKIRIELTKEQTDQCRKLFDLAAKEYKKGKPGMIVAQIGGASYDHGFMNVGYLNNELSLKFLEAIGKEPKIWYAKKA